MWVLNPSIISMKAKCWLTWSNMMFHFFHSIGPSTFSANALSIKGSNSCLLIQIHWNYNLLYSLRDRHAIAWCGCGPWWLFPGNPSPVRKSNSSFQCVNCVAIYLHNSYMYNVSPAMTMTYNNVAIWQLTAVNQWLKVLIGNIHLRLPANGNWNL